MVVFGGLGYDCAAWEADESSGWHLDGIWRCLEDIGSYLEDPKSWGYAQWMVTWQVPGSQILGICPVEGNMAGSGIPNPGDMPSGGDMAGSGGRKAYNLNDYKLTIYMLTRL